MIPEFGRNEVVIIYLDHWECPLVFQAFHQGSSWEPSQPAQIAGSLISATLGIQAIVYHL